MANKTNNEIFELLMSTVDKLADIDLYLKNNRKITTTKFDTINERIGLLTNEMKPTPRVKEDVDFEKEILHASPGLEGSNNAKPPSVDYDTPIQTVIVKEPTGKQIAHNGYLYQKLKTCKYGCGNWVAWNNNEKKFQHFSDDFKPIGEVGDCPKYA